MNEIILTTNISVDMTMIDQSRDKILVLKRQTAQNMIDIGAELAKVKEVLPHGDWYTWLENEVEFTPKTASQLIRIAKEFGDGENRKSLSDLGATKLYTLLDLPAEQRNIFLDTHDVQNMTTRELKEQISNYKKNSDIWKVFDLYDREKDRDMVVVKIDKLKPLKDHEKYFPSATGLTWLDFMTSIANYGVIEPIIITRDNTIISGHGRVRACKDLGMETIPAYYLAITTNALSNSNGTIATVEDIKLKYFFHANIHLKNIDVWVAKLLLNFYFGDKEKIEYYLNKCYKECPSFAGSKWESNIKECICA